MKARQIRIFAPAKLNLFLEVLGKRPDGYHEIRSVFHAINLCDEMVIEERKEGIHLDCSDPSLPADERNLAWRAAALMQKKAGTSTGVAMRLMKKIPVGAGLGGGSSDASAVLKGLNDLWRLGLSAEELMRMAAELGSDCPYFIRCGTALCEGRGEIVNPLPSAGRLRFILVCPPIQVSTAEVYKNLSRNDLTDARRDDSILRRAIQTGNWVTIGRELFNRLEGPAFRLFRELEGAKRRLREVCPHGTLMTGSGSALFGIVGQSTSHGQEVLERVPSLGLGRTWAVESLSIGHTAWMEGGGYRDDYRREGAAPRDQRRPPKGLLQHYVRQRVRR
jgi:4-diphosphocytidyl-2-C-methyl-D-erythritol kinase